MPDNSFIAHTVETMLNQSWRFLGSSSKSKPKPPPLSTCTILDLPNELLADVVKHAFLDDTVDGLALIRTNKHFHLVFKSVEASVLCGVVDQRMEGALGQDEETLKVAACSIWALIELSDKGHMCRKDFNGVGIGTFEWNLKTDTDPFKLRNIKKKVDENDGDGAGEESPEKKPCACSHGDKSTAPTPRHFKIEGGVSGPEVDVTIPAARQFLAMFSKVKWFRDRLDCQPHFRTIYMFFVLCAVRFDDVMPWEYLESRLLACSHMKLCKYVHAELGEMVKEVLTEEMGLILGGMHDHFLSLKLSSEPISYDKFAEIMSARILVFGSIGLIHILLASQDKACKEAAFRAFAEDWAEDGVCDDDKYLRKVTFEEIVDSQTAEEDEDEDDSSDDDDDDGDEDVSIWDVEIRGLRTYPEGCRCEEKRESGWL